MLQHTSPNTDARGRTSSFLVLGDVVFVETRIIGETLARARTQHDRVAALILITGHFLLSTALSI